MPDECYYNIVFTVTIVVVVIVVSTNSLTKNVLLLLFAFGLVFEIFNDYDRVWNNNALRSSETNVARAADFYISHVCRKARIIIIIIHIGGDTIRNGIQCIHISSCVRYCNVLLDTCSS